MRELGRANALLESKSFLAMTCSRLTRFYVDGVYGHRFLLSIIPIETTRSITQLA